MHLDRPLVALLVAAVALVVLVLLDRLRQRPVVLVVASLELFPETVEVTEAAARSRRREWRDLVLRGLAAVAFALALGGPHVAGAPLGRSVRIVLDRGASLQAREPSGRTRLALAKDEVRRALERLAPEDRVDLALVPPGPDEPPAGLAPAEAARALDAIRAVDAPGALAQAAGALAAAAADLARDPVRALPALAVSDREPAPGSVEPSLLAATRLALVGSPLANRAVVALASRRDARGRERLLAAVANLSGEPARIALELRFAASLDELAHATPLARPLDLGPGETRSVLVDDPGLLARTAVVEARIPSEDALALDDRALAVRRADPPVRIAVGGDLGRSVETALRACEGVSVELFPGGTTPLGGFDLTVARAERDDLPAPRGGLVLVCPPGPAAPATKPRAPLALEPRALALVPAASDAGLARALGSVGEVRAHPPGNLGTLEPLVTSADAARTSLVAASPASAASLVVYLGFDTASRAVEDGWARDPSFPRFWAEIVERVRERPAAPPPLEAHATGLELLVPRPADALPEARLEVLEPGEPARARRVRGGRYVPLEAGLHRVRAEGAKGEASFAAALLDPRASDLSSARARGFDDQTLARLGARDGRGAPLSLAGLVALLGLALAGIAWVLAAREPEPSKP